MYVLMSTVVPQRHHIFLHKYSLVSWEHHLYEPYAWSLASPSWKILLWHVMLVSVYMCSTYVDALAKLRPWDVWGEAVMTRLSSGDTFREMANQLSAEKCISENAKNTAVSTCFYTVCFFYLFLHCVRFIHCLLFLPVSMLSHVPTCVYTSRFFTCFYTGCGLYTVCCFYLFLCCLLFLPISMPSPVSTILCRKVLCCDQYFSAWKAMHPRVCRLSFQVPVVSSDPDSIKSAKSSKNKHDQFNLP